MFSTFVGVLPSVWLGYLQTAEISFILLHQNRLRMSHKLFKFFTVLIQIFEVVPKSSFLSFQILRHVLFTLHQRFYSFTYQENLLPDPTTYSPQKIHTIFSLSEIIFMLPQELLTQARDINTYQKVFMIAQTMETP